MLPYLQLQYAEIYSLSSNPHRALQSRIPADTSCRAQHLTRDTYCSWFGAVSRPLSDCTQHSHVCYSTLSCSCTWHSHSMGSNKTLGFLHKAVDQLKQKLPFWSINLYNGYVEWVITNFNYILQAFLEGLSIYIRA